MTMEASSRLLRISLVFSLAAIVKNYGFGHSGRRTDQRRSSSGQVSEGFNK